MRFIKTFRLTGQQKKEVENLMARCRSICPLQLNFPYEDGSVFYLAYNSAPDGSVPILVCALALIMPGMTGSETAECTAFTHPEFRRKGYFSMLFEEAQEEIEDLDLLFPVDGKDEAVIPVLRSLCAEFDYCEYKMELSLSSNAIQSHHTGRNGRLICRVETDHGDNSCLYRFFLPERNNHPVAVCRTVPFGSQICFFGFEVEKHFRGQGLGEEALLSVIDKLRGHADTITLHVTGDNAAAVNLYKKTGFRVTETLSYYLY